MPAKKRHASADESAGRRFVYYVAVSADGFIADENGGVDWLKPFQDRDYGFGEMMKDVDVVVVGRRTWDWTVQVTGGRGIGMRTYVLTSRPSTSSAADVTMLSDPAELVAEIRARPGKDVFVVGGAATAAAMLDAGALDVIDMHVMPIALGAGKRLLGPLRRSVKLELKAQKAYPNGVVRLRYELRR